MPKLLLFAFLLVARGCAAMGGEDWEHMPVRGNVWEKGSVGFNGFRSEHPFPYARGGEASPAIRGIRPDIPSGMNGGFLKWKSHCRARSPVVEGEALSMGRLPDFLGVAPYISRPAHGGGIFSFALAPE